jgi:hypothetical protein
MDKEGIIEVVDRIKVMDKLKFENNEIKKVLLSEKGLTLPLEIEDTVNTVKGKELAMLEDLIKNSFSRVCNLVRLSRDLMNEKERNIAYGINEINLGICNYVFNPVLDYLQKDYSFKVNESVESRYTEIIHKLQAVLVKDSFSNFKKEVRRSASAINKLLQEQDIKITKANSKSSMSFHEEFA